MKWLLCSLVVTLCLAVVSAHWDCRQDAEQLCPKMHWHEAMACLKSHPDQLSDACAASLGISKPVVGERARLPWERCTPDLAKFCNEIKPEEYHERAAEVHGCMLDHRDELSDSCLEVVKLHEEREEEMRGDHSTEVEADWRACQDDKAKFCGNVPADDLCLLRSCMKEHGKELSSPCLQTIFQHAKEKWSVCSNDRLEYCGEISTDPAHWVDIKECMEDHEAQLSAACSKLIKEERACDNRAKPDGPRPHSPIPWYKCQQDRARFFCDFSNWQETRNCLFSHRDAISKDCADALDQFDEAQKPAPQPEPTKPQPLPLPPQIYTVPTPNYELFVSCHYDRVTLCPGIPPPYTAFTLFTSPCFNDHKDQLSQACRRLFDLFHNGGPIPDVGQSSSNLVSSCNQDRVALCPDIQPPYYPSKLFHSACFEQKREQLSPECRSIMDEFLKVQPKPQHPPLPPPPPPPPLPQTVPSTQQGSVQGHPNQQSLLSCHEDRIKMCPEVNPRDFFSSDCFLGQQDKFSSACLAYYENRHSHELGESYPHPIVTDEAVTTACKPGRDALCPDEPLTIALFKTSCFTKNEDSFPQICRYMAHSVVAPDADGAHPADLGRNCIEEWMSLCPSEWRESEGTPVILFKSKCMELEAPRMSPVCLSIVQQLDSHILSPEPACDHDFKRFCNQERGELSKDDIFQKKCFVDKLNFVSFACRHDYLTWLHEHANANYVSDEDNRKGPVDANDGDRDTDNDSIDGDKHRNKHHNKDRHKNPNKDHGRNRGSNKHQSVYYQCQHDAQTFCKEDEVTSYEAHHFFNFHCIKENYRSLSPPCIRRYREYRRHLSLGQRITTWMKSIPPVGLVILCISVGLLFFLLVACLRTCFLTVSNLDDFDVASTILLPTKDKDQKTVDDEI